MRVYYGLAVGGGEGGPRPLGRPPGTAPWSRCLLPCPQEVLLKRAADLAEALYGVPSSNQVWCLLPPPSAADPGAVPVPAPAAAQACHTRVFTGAPAEARGGCRRGSVQRPPSACATRAPGAQPPAPRRRGHQRLQQPAGRRSRGSHTGTRAGCVPQFPARHRPLPGHTACLTTALSQATPAAAAARLRAGLLPAQARSRAATAAASERASAATGLREWLALACPAPLASSMAPRPPHPSPVSAPYPRK